MCITEISEEEKSLIKNGKNTFTNLVKKTPCIDKTCSKDIKWNKHKQSHIKVHHGQIIENQRKQVVKASRKTTHYI